MVIHSEQVFDKITSFYSAPTKFIRFVSGFSISARIHTAYIQFGMPYNDCMMVCCVFSLESGGGRVARRCWVNFQCRGVLLIRIIVGQGPIVLAVGAGGGCMDIFLSSITSHFFLPLSGRRPDID